MFRSLLLAFAVVQCTAKSVPRIYSKHEELPEIKNKELLEMSKILRKVDSNKAEPGQILINYQNHTHEDEVDDAAEPLFTKVSKELLNKTTYKRFIDVMNDFHKVTIVPERRNSQDKQDRIRWFLDSILASKPWEILGKFLRKNHHPFIKDEKFFRRSIRRIWFNYYSRGNGMADTSGFEHVFIGKKRKGGIDGLHNWVRFYMLEKNATENFDYMGYITIGGNVTAQLKFSWEKAIKRKGSFLIGTSPEYEMALYTMCFLYRRDEPCEVELDGLPLTVKSQAWAQDGKEYIRTIYPQLREPYSNSWSGQRNHEYYHNVRRYRPQSR